MSNLKATALTAIGTLIVAAGSMPCEAKRGSFLTPTYEKMTDGASPQTNDVSGANAEANANAAGSNSKPIQSASLPPAWRLLI